MLKKTMLTLLCSTLLCSNATAGYERLSPAELYAKETIDNKKLQDLNAYIYQSTKLKVCEVVGFRYYINTTFRNWYHHAQVELERAAKDLAFMPQTQTNIDILNTKIEQSKRHITERAKNNNTWSKVDDKYQCFQTYSMYNFNRGIKS